MIPLPASLAIPNGIQTSSAVFTDYTFVTIGRPTELDQKGQATNAARTCKTILNEIK